MLLCACVSRNIFTYVQNSERVKVEESIEKYERVSTLKTRLHHAVTGHFGQDPFRPYFLAETSPFSGTFRPRNMDVSAKKYGRFGQKIGTFRPRNMDVSAKKYGRFGQNNCNYCF